MSKEYQIKWNLSGKGNDGLEFVFPMKRSLYNRWKWWIATKLFLPGYSEWQKEDISNGF